MTAGFSFAALTGRFRYDYRIFLFPLGFSLSFSDSIKYNIYIIIKNER